MEYPTKEDLEIRALALAAASRVIAAVVEPNTASAYAEAQTVHTTKRFETYLRTGE